MCQIKTNNNRKAVDVRAKNVVMRLFKRSALVYCIEMELNYIFLYIIKTELNYIPIVH